MCRQVERLVTEVSDPSGTQYGKYLTAADLRQLTAAPADVVNRVASYFEAAGASCSNPAGSALRCTGSVAVAERALSTKLALYTHGITGTRVVRVQRGSTISLPDSIADDVQFVSGINQLFDRCARARSSLPRWTRSSTPFAPLYGSCT